MRNRSSAAIQATLLACCCAVPLYAQVTDMVAHRKLNIRGNLKGDVQLLDPNGEFYVADEAHVFGDARLPERPGNPGGDSPLRRVAQTVRVNAKASAVRGQLLESSTFTLPALRGPTKPKGRTALKIERGNQKPSTFDDVRDINISNRDDVVAIPPGSYGSLRIRDARVVLGTAGTSKPTRYDFESINLGGAGQIQLAGPVVICVGTVDLLHGIVGREDMWGWLDLRIESGAVRIARGSRYYGSLYAPNSDVLLDDITVTEGWIGAASVTIEPRATFVARRFALDPAIAPHRQPSFPQKAVLIQNRLHGLRAHLSAEFSLEIVYDGDVPTLILSEVLGRGRERKPAIPDHVAFFGAFRALLDNTYAESGRVILHKANGAGSNSVPAIEVSMSNTDFLGHIWAVGREENTAIGIRKIESSPGLKELFMTRSVKVAAALATN